MEALRFEVESRDFTSDFVIYPGHEVFLGIPWTLENKPVGITAEGELQVGNYIVKTNLSKRTEPKLEPIKYEEINWEADETYLIQASRLKEETELPTAIGDLLNEFAGLLEEPGIPKDRDIEHEILLKKGKKPPEGKYLRLSTQDLKECKTQVEDLLKKGFIEPSAAPQGASVLFVVKKDGTRRFCVDYRALNALTVKDAYNMPRIDEVLDTLAGGCVFSTLDLKSGYHQIKVAKESVPLTTFRTRYGSYQWRVMPFGLVNAPATFMKLMNRVLMPFIDDFVAVYLDDIIVFSKNWSDHLLHLRKVFEVLQKEGLKVNPKKCTFGKTELPFLGHIVTRGGIKVDPPKVDAIDRYPRPKTAADIRRFLGMTGWYRRYIPEFAHTALPLSTLLDEKIKFVWTSAQQEAFEALKKKLVTAPILMYPDTKKAFVLKTDASNAAIGAELLQVGEDGRLHPVAFSSHKLKTTQLNWPTREKELFSIFTAVKAWKPYLNNGSQTLVFMDHKTLTSLLTQKEHTGRVWRWLEYLQQYDLRIVYEPGKRMVVPDALSRPPAIKKLILDTTGLSEFIKKGYNEDLALSNVIKQLKQDADSFPPYRLKNDFLFILSKDDETERLVLPEKSKVIAFVLSELHGSSLSSHLGTKKTLEVVRRNYYWKKMRDDVHDLVKKCDICQRAKNSKTKSGLSQPLPPPSKPFEEISLDLLCELPKTSRGCDSILLVVDRLSKYLTAIPTSKSADAKELAELLFTHVVCQRGLPRRCV